MGEIDAVLNVFMSKPERIQSVLEYCLKERLPHDWSEKCVDAPKNYGTINLSGKHVPKERDVFKKIKGDKEDYYLGIENQAKVNLIFPWRLMQMDCLAYERQIEEIQTANMDNGTTYGSEDDYLYQFTEGDRLKPIINLILYWGKRKWKRSQALQDMMELSGMSKRIQTLFEDYQIHLIDMRAIPMEDVEKMESDLRYVLGLMKCEERKEDYREYIERNSHFLRTFPKAQWM